MMRPLSGCIAQDREGRVSVDPRRLLNSEDTVRYEVTEVMESINVD